MEVMEDGNLLDRVRILLQRDSNYYEQHQKVLQEALCSGVAGGALDFPHHASFAAVKMVTWWEEQHILVFGVPSGLIRELAEKERAAEGGGGAGAGAADFVSVVTSSCSQLLTHLHALTQEALDHADLQVLTSTLGAAAVVSGALWLYNHNKERFLPQHQGGGGGTLSHRLKEMRGMCEALAERLLDLHCRLLSLYVLQDGECLSWEAPRPFFESERGSFVVQMWWLYMQGTREDLWSTVPPKTAQRVFAGMLNESLTILSVRYSQACPSDARQPLIVNDICNLLSCVAQLLPALCSGARELTGEKPDSKAVSHVHDKCQLLLSCLLFKGAPLSKLYKKFLRGLDGAECFEAMPGGRIAPWFAFVNEDVEFGPRSVGRLPAKKAISLELSVLLAQPHASWGLLLKV